MLHIAQSPLGAGVRAGLQQAVQQRMVNLSAYGRPGGELQVLSLLDTGRCFLALLLLSLLRSQHVRCF